MKTKIFCLLMIGLLIGCSSGDPADPEQTPKNKVLLLKVDYTSEVFEGGKEFHFPEPSEAFTIAERYEPPGDFGIVELRYEEINEVLFFGTIVWMGLGEMSFPANIRPPEQFALVETEDYVSPGKGFENIFDPYDQQEENFDYTEIWASVQNLVKVREYLDSNPNQKVKIFLYAPSVGVGNPLDWDWFIFMKK